MLTFDVWNNNSYFCATLRPPSPLPEPDSAGMYCPLGPGDFALSSSIHLGPNYQLATYNTRLRALDPSQNELLCLDLDTTPVKPNSMDPIVGEFHGIFWGSVALAIAYWLVVGIARLVTARGRGSSNGQGIWAKVEGAGFILASAISGERLATSPALMRFCKSSRYCVPTQVTALNDEHHSRHPIIARHHLSHTVVCSSCHGSRAMAWLHLCARFLHILFVKFDAHHHLLRSYPLTDGLVNADIQ